MSTTKHVSFFIQCTAVLAKTSHANCRTTLPNRPSRGRRGRFVRVVQQLACEVFQRTAVHTPTNRRTIPTSLAVITTIPLAVAATFPPWPHHGLPSSHRRRPDFPAVASSHMSLAVNSSPAPPHVPPCRSRIQTISRPHMHLPLCLRLMPPRRSHLQPPRRPHLQLSRRPHLQLPRRPHLRLPPPSPLAAPPPFLPLIRQPSQQAAPPPSPLAVPQPSRRSDVHPTP